MYTKIKILIIPILSVVLVLNLNAQQSKGDKFFDDLAYADAISCYEKAIENEALNDEAKQALTQKLTEFQ